MTDHWNFYALQVDDQPASIFVDLGAEARAPVSDLPHMAYISLRLRQPRPDGLSSSEEFDALVGAENALEQSLCSDEVAYVGRNTSSGCRDFFLPFGIRVWRMDTPSYQEIDGVTMPLYEAAARHGGDYDGWECVIVT